MSVVCVSIEPAGGDGWTATWSADGRPAGAPVVLDADAVRELAGLARRFDRPADPIAAGGRHARPVLLAPHVDGIGATLHKRVVGPEAAAALRTARELHVRTRLPDALNLPWELLPAGPTDKPIGTDADRALYRLAVAPPAADADAPPPGPLRVLFLAAAPTDQPQLNYEQEEELILKAVGGLVGVVVWVAEMGSVEELARRVQAFRPHVVHLSGHGGMGAGGAAHFSFEREDGTTDPVGADALVRRAFDGVPVRCVFLNACETAQAAVSGLCQGLVAAGVPLALGWAAAVADDRATAFAQEFYTHLGAGASAARAVAFARRRIREDGADQRDGVAVQDVTFALPQLYAARPGAALYDPTRTDVYTGPRTRYSRLPDGVVGLTEGFVGRRREQQQLLPALRSGDVTVLVLLGHGGQGKSTLATRLANRLQEPDHGGGHFELVSVRFVPEDDETPAKMVERKVSYLVQELRTTFERLGHARVVELMSDPKASAAGRLIHAVDGLAACRVLLVLDNLEDVIDLSTRTLIDPALAAFYARLMSNLTAGSRVIVTTRVVPAGTPAANPQVRVVKGLADFTRHDFLKFLRWDARVDERIKSGELPEGVLDGLYAEIGGTPRFLELLRKTLQTCDGGKLWKELKAGAGLVEEARDRYIEGIFGDKLFASLTDDGRLAATRVAVALLPVPLDGVAMATGLPEPRAKAAVSNALAYGLLQEIGGTTLRYQAPGLLAGWLAAPARLLPADATAAHLALAGFWRGVVEGDREGDIGVHFMEGLDGCRRHAATGGDPALALWSASRMASALTRFAQWGRSCELLTDALKGLGDTPPPEVDEERAIALHELGTAVMRQGKFEIARGHFREALDLNRRAGIVAGEVASRSQLAYIEQATGNMAAARAEYKAVADAHRWAKNELGEANARHNLASLDLAQGDFPAARAELTEVLAIRQRLQDHRGEADTLHQLAAVDMLQGDYPAARDTTHRALEIQRREGDVAGQADSHYQLGCVALHQGRHEAGVRLIAACVLIEQQIGYKDAPKDLDGLLVLCQRLGYDEAQIRDMFADVAKSYAHDRGDALLREAFPDADWWKSPTDPPTPSSS